MPEQQGRAPRPKRGDPNVKVMRLTLATDEWRKLRVWAAEEDTSVQQVVVQILRKELDRRPPRGY